MPGSGRDLIESANTFIFDCDGVILNSNNLKKKVFRKLSLKWGVGPSDKFMLYLLGAKGLSRNDLFKHLIFQILPEFGFRYCEKESYEILSWLVALFSKEMGKRLLRCDVAEHLKEVKERYPKSNWLIISAGSTQEIKSVFIERKIFQYFNNGIYGGPESKHNIIKKLSLSGIIKKPVVFFGDSINDYEAALHAGFLFVFVSKWTDMDNWPEFTLKKNIPTLNTVADLLN
jgi:HAD superfamily hydrolase (TIGR01549 family)